MNKRIDSEDILAFWFSEPVSKLWFNSTPEFDLDIRQMYESVYLDAKNGNLDRWMESATGCLALIIVLDQFPLNMYRGNKESFAAEDKSLMVSKYAIERSFDKQLTDQQKSFLYMPLMHSEDIKDQNLSVELYEKSNLTNNIRFARHHRDIVKRFGRFPHRNDILGRQSTDEELEYLISKEAFLG